MVHLNHSLWRYLLTRFPLTLAALFSCSLALAQTATSRATVPQRAALPVVFSKTLSADKAKVGDLVQARTMQVSRLNDGQIVPSGTELVGHVTAAVPFVYDKTHYAVQKQATLSIHFDAIQLAGKTVPVNVALRAMADPISSWDAREARSTDLDPDGTVTQIGGDQLVPSQAEVVDRNGDVVAYNRRDGVYAHLIARAHCDGSTNEVSVAIYSASACGLYGFGDVALGDAGSLPSASDFTLVSTHTSPKIWRNSTALLEVAPQAGR